ncbi:MAG: trypsin-like peptidase domain-containing protein [Chloroflexi bacterium]|nr:trypsin-like peptidase domain-containing protein [Chloroflexota bacterium]
MALASLLVASLLLAACGKSSAKTPTPGAAAQAGAATPGVNQTPAPTNTPSAKIDISTSFPNIRKVTEEVRPAVVSIFVRTVSTNFFLQAVPQEGAGSGVIFDKAGFIVTNNHVVEGATKMDVVLPDGRSFSGTLIGRDPTTDLAVVKIDGQNLPIAPLGDASKMQIGDWVVAIGNALGLEGGPTVTQGVISALNRTIAANSSSSLENLIQTDAAINPGNSGGPLVNLDGEVIGINTAIISQAQGIGFAISINSAKPIIQELQEKGKIVRPWIGISLVAVTPSIASQLGLSVEEGILVMDVLRGGPADTAGLRRGDIITEVEGKKMKASRDLTDLISSHKVGDKIEATYMRSGKSAKVTVTLGERPVGP